MRLSLPNRRPVHCLLKLINTRIEAINMVGSSNGSDMGFTSPLEKVLAKRLDTLQEEHAAMRESAAAKEEKLKTCVDALLRQRACYDQLHSKHESHILQHKQVAESLQRNIESRDGQLCTAQARINELEMLLHEKEQTHVKATIALQGQLDKQLAKVAALQSSNTRLTVEQDKQSNAVCVIRGVMEEKDALLKTAQRQLEQDSNATSSE